MEPVFRADLRPRTGNFVVMGQRSFLVTSQNNSLTYWASETGSEQSFSKELQPELPVGESVINQVNVVLLDGSGTMGTVSPQLKKRKVDAALEYANTFFRGVAEF
jgi:hypothetical protein